MSAILAQLKKDQIEARKARDSVRANLLTTAIGESSTISKDEHKRGITEPTDLKVITTLKVFVGNIDTALNGDEAKGQKPVSDEAARAKLLAERAILEPYIPEEFSEVQLREKIAEAAPGETLTLKDTKRIKDALDAQYPGQVSPKMLSEILRNYA